MTQRLYLIDSHLFENECTVLACEPAKEGFDVRLDKTVFFPNKGGQPCDTGVLGAVRVTDVREVGDELILRTDGPLPVGEAVTGRIDEARRLDVEADAQKITLRTWNAKGEMEFSKTIGL